MSAAVGLACSIKDGLPVVHAAILNGGTIELFFRHSAAAHDDWALQLRSLHDMTVTSLGNIDIDSVVVRGPDYNSRRGLTAPTSRRLAAEGVLVAAARQQVTKVAYLTGKEVGERLGIDKAEIEERAVSMGCSNVLKQAGAAALAAQALRNDE